jgi:hypothetical protein
MKTLVVTRLAMAALVAATVAAPPADAVEITGLAAASASAADSAWTPAAEAPLAGAADIRETRWETARPPGGTYDRIRVHRYRAAEPAKAAVLYLPGTNMNGQVALADEDHNLWVFLARRGVEVYALDYRTAFPPSSGVSDLGFIYSAAKSGSKDVTLNVLERYGHLDIVVGEKARADVYEPTLAWILERAR